LSLRQTCATLAFYLSLNSSVISGDGSNQNEIQEMALTLFGIPNCDTVKKARAWLTQHGVDYEFHDYKRFGTDAQTLARWVDVIGWDRLLNRAGTTYRKLPEADKKGVDGPDARSWAIAIMSAHPSTIKRPVVEGDGLLLVGFKADAWATSFPA
jgi:arsenate reductase (glutaredoxin)